MNVSEARSRLSQIGLRGRSPVRRLGARTNADAIQASVDAGRIIFNAGAAAACLAFFDGLSCADFWDSFLTGTHHSRPPARPRSSGLCRSVARA